MEIGLHGVTMESVVLAVVTVVRCSDTDHVHGLLHLVTARNVLEILASLSLATGTSSAQVSAAIVSKSLCHLYKFVRKNYIDLLTV